MIYCESFTINIFRVSNIIDFIANRSVSGCLTVNVDIEGLLCAARYVVRYTHVAARV